MREKAREKIISKLFISRAADDKEKPKEVSRRRARHRYERPSMLLAMKHFSTPGQSRRESQKALCEKMISNMLQLHNFYRAHHSVPALTISQRLNYISQKYAEHLAATSKFEHSGTKFEDKPLGENLFMQWISEGKVPVSAREAAKSWYNECESYSYKNPQYSEETAHFTQMIWKSSQRIGVGVALSADEREVYIVTHYYPAGNIINHGYFEKNVLPLTH